MVNMVMCTQALLALRQHASASGDSAAEGDEVDEGMDAGADGSAAWGLRQGRTAAFTYIAPSEQLLGALGRWMNAALLSAPNRAAILLDQYRSGACPVHSNPPGPAVLRIRLRRET